MTANRQEILATPAARRAEIARRFGVQWLALFGSAARDELRPDSDVDVLVAFDGPATFDGYFGLKEYLEARRTSGLRPLSSRRRGDIRGDREACGKQA